MEFLDGATCVAFLAVALWFLRFWRDSGDRVLALFALAFFVFGLNRILFVLADPRHEGQVSVYAVRGIAFAIILVAMLEGNRRTPDSR